MEQKTKARWWVFVFVPILVLSCRSFSKRMLAHPFSFMASKNFISSLLQIAFGALSLSPLESIVRLGRREPDTCSLVFFEDLVLLLICN